MGLCPDSFGPYFWGAFHLACLAAVDMNGLKAFIESYQHVLPCGGCRMHFSQLLNELPFPEDKSLVFKWSVDVHNIVNIRLGKPIMTFDAAMVHWLSGCEKKEPEEIKEKPFWDKYTIVLVVLLIAFILILSLKNFRE